MKRLKEFLKNHLSKLTLGVVILMAVIHFMVNFNLIQNTKLIGESWTNLINGYILIITMSVGLIFLIWLAFLMHKETAKDLERFLLKNLTTACFLLIMFLGFHGILGNLEKSFTLTAIGAIIAFWYGYKTYERDKEIEMIEKFEEGKFTINTLDDDLDRMSHAFFLHKEGYISDYLWYRIDLKIDKLVFEFFNENLKGKEINELRANNKISNTLAKIKYEGGFMNYFIQKLEAFQNTLKDHSFSEIEQKEMDRITTLILSLYQLINKKNN